MVNNVVFYSLSFCSAKDCDLITLGTYATVNDYREEGGVDAVGENTTYNNF